MDWSAVFPAAGQLPATGAGVRFAEPTRAGSDPGADPRARLLAQAAAAPAAPVPPVAGVPTPPPETTMTPGGPTTARLPPTATGLGARIKAAYNAASARAGRHLTWDDPTVLLIWQVLGGLTPEQAQAASRRGAEYAHQTGRLLSDDEVDQFVTETKTRLPNQYDVGYGLGSAVQTAFQNVQAQYPGAPLADDDPRLLAAVRQGSPELGAITPQQLSQIVRLGRQYTGATGQLAGAGLDTAIGQIIGRPPIPAPHQMDPAAYDAIHADPVKLGLWQAALKRRGWDVGTYEAQHTAARPVGTAVSPATAGQGSAWSRPPTGVWG